MLIERQVTTQILYHLKEIDRRKLFFDLGCSSLEILEIGADSETKKKALKEVKRLSKKECEKKLLELTREKKLKETKKKISDDKVKVAVVLSDETLATMDKVKALLDREMSMDELILYMAEAATQRVEKEKFRQTPKAKVALSPAKVVSKKVPDATKREAYKRDQKCTKCESRYNLNFDHRKAFALGGESSIENIRMLCFHCNQRERIKQKLYQTRFTGR